MSQNSQEALEARLAALEDAHQRLQGDFKHLRNFVYHQYFYNQRLLEKAFQVACFGDYLEFGVFEGASIVQSYNAAQRIFQRMENGDWDVGHRDIDKKTIYRDAWKKMRFIGFDTFEGMPALNEIDSKYDMFEEGTFLTTLDKCRGNIEKGGVPKERVELVKGRFEDTLNEQTSKSLELKAVSIVNIDCDLYSSALEALDFVTPYLQDGSIIIFDEWYHYKGNPSLGEQRAFHEWKSKNPQFTLNEFHKEGPYRNSFIVTTKTY